MGQYTEIYVRTRDGLPPRTDARLYFVIIEGAKDGPVGAQWCVKNDWRYSPGGDEWPETAETLMLLLTAPNVETVWYFGDCTIDQNAPDNICTLERVREYTREYLADAESPVHPLHAKWTGMLDVPVFPRVNTWRPPG